MDINVLSNHFNKPGQKKSRTGNLFVLVVLLGLLIITSGCADETEAASDSQQNSEENVSALTGGSKESAVRLVAQGSTVLHFDPSSGQVAVGGVQAVQVRLENVENLYGIEVHLTFDKDIVQVVDENSEQDGVQIAVGEIPHPDFTVQNMVDNFGGRLDYAVVQLSPRPAASGSGVVATIRFRGIQPGTSAIHFSHVKLASPDGFAIPVTWQDGAIVVGEGPAVTQTPTSTAEPRPTLTPTQPPAVTPTVTPTPVPVATATPPVVSCPALYLVRSGDTAYSIARRYGVSLEALAAANDLSSSYKIKIGQLLVVPGVPGPTGTVHLVGVGETLYSIARRYGTTVETLVAINHLSYPWNAQLGQKMLICPP